jgi:hypothetical protein
MDAARSYQVGFVQYFNELLAKMIKAGRENQEEVQKMKFDMNALPKLNFQEATLAESWNSAAVDLLILFLLFVCLFMFAFFGFVRGDIR